MLALILGLALGAYLEYRFYPIERLQAVIEDRA